jgi:hypothetical protein
MLIITKMYWPEKKWHELKIRHEARNERGAWGMIWRAHVGRCERKAGVKTCEEGTRQDLKEGGRTWKEGMLWDLKGVHVMRPDRAWSKIWKEGTRHERRAWGKIWNDSTRKNLKGEIWKDMWWCLKREHEARLGRHKARCERRTRQDLKRGHVVRSKMRACGEI